MTQGGQKGFGMTKHGRSGHATRSPRFRFLQKLEAQKNNRKDRSRIKEPKQSVEELFHPRTVAERLMTKRSAQRSEPPDGSTVEWLRQAWLVRPSGPSQTFNSVRPYARLKAAIARTAASVLANPNGSDADSG